MTPSFWVGQLDYARFVYGLALVAVAMGCGVLDARDQEGPSWRWLAAFAALHGMNEWLDLVSGVGAWAGAVHAIQMVLWTGSFVALGEFGRRSNPRPLPVWSYLAVVVAGVWGAAEGAAGFKAALGYALVLPGGLAAAVALGRRGHGSLKFAAALGVYVLLSGAFPPEAGFFPASMLHREAFRAWTGVPIWIPRGAACVWLAVVLWHHVRRLDTHRVPHARASSPPVWMLGLLGGVLVVGWGMTEGLGRQATRELARSAVVEAASFAARTTDALDAERFRAQTLATLPRVRVALSTAGVDPVGLDPATLGLSPAPGGLLRLSAPGGATVALARTGGSALSFPGRSDVTAPGVWFGRTRDAEPGLCAYHPVVGFDGLVVLGRAMACRSLFLFEETGSPGRRIVVTAPDGTETATDRARHSAGRPPVTCEASVDGTPWTVRVERSSTRVVLYRLFGIGGTLFACVLGLSLYVVSERRQAAARAVATSEHQMRRVLQVSPDGIAVIGRSDGRVRWANDGLSRLTEVDADDLPGREMSALFTDTQGLHPPWDTLAHNLAHGCGTWRVRGTDGDPRVLEAAAAEAVLGGEPCVVATLRDVTEREVAARRLADSEARYRAMMAAMDDRAYICSAGGRIEYANPALIRWVGRDPTGDRCHRALYGLSHRCPQCPQEQTPEGRRWEFTSPRDGRAYCVVQTPLEWADGSRSRLSLVRDITERRRTEDALRAEKEFADRLVLGSAVAAFVLDTEHRVRVWNPACAKLTGVPAHRIVGTRRAWEGFYAARRPTLADLVLDGDADASPEGYGTITRSALNPRGRHAEGWFPDLNGRDRYLSFDAAPIRDAQGRVTAVIETLQDHTASKRAEARSALLGTAVDQAAETILVTDIEGRVQYANPAFEQVTGYTVAEVLGRPVSMLKSGAHDRSFYDDLWDTIRGGGVWTGTFRNQKKDGTPFEEEATISPVIDVHGRTTHYVAVKRDVTHEAEMARQLRQAQKLDALGTLAGGIAHDFNNILTSIIGYTELTLDDVPEGSVAADNLARVLAGGERAQAMVRQILTFSREDDGQREVVALGPVAEEVAGLLRAALPPRVTLTLRSEAPDTRVRADTTQIHQVLMNLGTNAAHALGPDGGDVEIVVARADFDDPAGGVHPDIRAGAYLRISVSDDGCGMDPEVASRVFDPFFTTKGVGEGTGLGLSVAHGIVQGHGGAIHLHTAPGVGTTFHVFLPLAEGADVSGEIQGAPDSRLHVLVADDEAEVAELVEQVLVNLGYRVTLCAGGPEAIARFQAAPDDFDLVVTDQTMPGATGFDLVRAARTAKCGIPVVLMTGFERQTTRDEALALGVNELLLKPLTVRELAAAVRRAVAPGDDPVLRATGGAP